MFNVHGKCGVFIRTIRLKYLEGNILVHPDKGGRCDKHVAVQCMKLVSASFQIAIRYCQNVAESNGCIELGEVTVPDTLLFFYEVIY